MKKNEENERKKRLVLCHIYGHERISKAKLSLFGCARRSAAFDIVWSRTECECHIPNNILQNNAIIISSLGSAYSTPTFAHNMASTTPQQGRRWLSRHSTQNEIASSSEAQRTTSQESNISSNTQPRSLNNPQSAQPSSTSRATVDASTVTSSQDSSPPAEVRTCWICQQDDTEDTPDNNIWRTPCPCSLTAHDSCLLEWIANEEAPKPGQLGHNRKIVCPQCQAEIKIQRPHDYFVSAVDNIYRAARMMILPTVAGATVGGVYTGLLVYGMNAMALVFGSEKASELLMAGVDDSMFSWTPHYKSVLRTLAMVTDPFIPSGENLDLKLFATLPLIGPALVLMRTRFADQYFPLLAPLVSHSSPIYTRMLTITVLHQALPPNPNLASLTRTCNSHTPLHPTSLPRILQPHFCVPRKRMGTRRPT